MLRLLMLAKDYPLAIQTRDKLFILFVAQALLALFILAILIPEHEGVVLAGILAV